jgi:hypothetical protein
VVLRVVPQVVLRVVPRGEAKIRLELKGVLQGAGPPVLNRLHLLLHRVQKVQKLLSF